MLDTTSHVVGTLTDLTRSKGELIAENMFLRQQVIVLEQQITHPQLRPWDRQILVLLASRLRGWREALGIVQPNTLVGVASTEVQTVLAQEVTEQTWQTTPCGRNHRVD